MTLSAIRSAAPNSSLVMICSDVCRFLLRILPVLSGSMAHAFSHKPWSLYSGQGQRLLLIDEVMEF